MTRFAGALALWLSVIAIAACDLGPVPFHCEESEQCVDEGVTGKCEANGFCSFPELGTACPSERRYGIHASEELSGACVPVCVKDIALGADGHGCLLKTSGEVYCWGNNAGGRLGTGQSADVLPPTQVPGIEDATAIAAGGGHTCAIRGEGDSSTLWCWGESGEGQTGIVEETVTAPREITLAGEPLAGIQALALGERHTCFLVAPGTIHCLGADDLGQLGSDDVAGSSAEPVIPTSLNGPSLSLLAVGANTTCVQATNEPDGKKIASCWGANDCYKFGKIGGPFFTLERAFNSETEDIIGIAVGGTHICYVTDRTTCAGAIVEPDEECMPEHPPPLVQLDGEARAPLQLVAGQAHSCLLYEEGEVRCWGAGQQGQLGSSTAFTGMAAVIPQIDNESGSDAKVTRITAAGNTTCALTEAGRVVCWGANDSGQLGTTPGEPETDLVDAVMAQVACP